MVLTINFADNSIWPMVYQISSLLSLLFMLAIEVKLPQMCGVWM